MGIPVIIADYPAKMPLIAFGVIAVIAFFGTAASLASTKKPEDERTARMMFVLAGGAVFLWSGYVLLKDWLHPK